MPVKRGNRHNIVMDKGAWALVCHQAKRAGKSVSEHIRGLVNHEEKKHVGYANRDHGGRKARSARGTAAGEE